MARHGIYPRDTIPPVPDYYDSGRFGRMLGKLPSFAADTPRIHKARMETGAVDDLMDAREPLDADPQGPDRRSEPVGGHNSRPAADMTFDPTSRLERPVDPEHIANVRTPSLALDNVYGAGPGDAR